MCVGLAGEFDLSVVASSSVPLYRQAIRAAALGLAINLALGAIKLFVPDFVCRATGGSSQVACDDVVDAKATLQKGNELRSDLAESARYKNGPLARRSLQHSSTFRE